MEFAEAKEIGDNNLRKISGSILFERPPEICGHGLIEFSLNVLNCTPNIFECIDDDCGIYGFCVHGVRERVRRSGGECVFGWCIWEWQQVWWNAEFHCIWRNEKGHCLDITPKPFPAGRIVFAQDARYPSEYDFTNRPRNIRHRIPLEDAFDQYYRSLSDGELKSDQKRMRRARSTHLALYRARRTLSALDALIDRAIELSASVEEYDDATRAIGTAAEDGTLQRMRIEQTKCLLEIHGAINRR